MAAARNNSAVSPDTLITIKISVNDSLKKLKLPLRDLGLNVLPDKLRQVLDIKPEQHVLLERYSDSAAGYVTLDESNPQVFKTLIRAAKAKLKLRLKATVTPAELPEISSKSVEKYSAAIQKHMQDAMSRTSHNANNIMSPRQQGLESKVQEKEVVDDERSAPKKSEATIAPRDSTAFDQRSIGSGIFQFKEARASQQSLANDEAPMPRPFVTEHSNPVHNVVAPSFVPLQPTLAFRPRELPAAVALPPSSAWSVYCNECDKAMQNEHYHCSICEGGDYDLCQECINSGKSCPGENHWLIKRSIQNGKVVNSTTERVPSRKEPAVLPPAKWESTAEKEMPGTFTEETKTLTEDTPTPTRTCNCCVIVLPEREFVTCTTCDDYDLCIKCHTSDSHGHHPAHGFKPATVETILPLSAHSKLSPGRNVRHNAICDGCDKKIFGVRHKCLNCPDWDYCGECIKTARQSHPRHRFAPLYQPIADQGPSVIRHFGIFCDGPMCKGTTDQSYIRGVRYKCTICHDTDFCASCEALPGNHHNRTHPLIKLQTPVRSVAVSTENEDGRGNVRIMGDRQASTMPSQPSRSAATEVVPVQQANAATQVQTVAEFTPTEVKREATPDANHKSIETAAQSVVSSSQLNAHFVRDSIPDGMVVVPEQLFTQVWTLKNPGPYAWPAGCSVRYVGGDNMFNVDNSHPASVTAIADATESNVVGREVLVGEEVAFKVVLKAPVREGKSISYWRLKASDGTPFGHKLWCDIEIKRPAQAVPIAVVPSPPLPPPVPTHNQQQQQHQAMMQQMAAQRQRMQQMQTARIAAHQKNLERMAQATQNGPPVIPSPNHSEQIPTFDSANLSARLSALREHQKQRRDAMIAHMNAQRDQQQAASLQGWSHPLAQSSEAAAENERRDALKQRIALIKANILKGRQESAKLPEAVAKQGRALQEKSEKSEKSEEEAEKAKQSVLDVTEQADDEHEADEQLEGSHMVFPKLDKESPASSTYQSVTSNSGKGKAAYVENEAGEIEHSAAPVAVPASPSEEEFVDLDDELEVLSANDDESDDDGFLTDEEYDILDASDQETVGGK